jgi:predicted ATP-binding protein involved in virulence
LAAYEDHALKAVRKSISALLPNVSQMTVDRKKLVLFINKGDSVLDFSTLSDGEKGIITLFGDIARRLAIANETLENPLEGNGIILIDEIELHLHPSWQRKVCKALKETFPNCQFIITTHSPQVLGELKTEEIWLLNDFNVYRPDSSYGLTSNEILDEIMDVIDDDTSLSRDSEIAKKLNEVSTLVELEKFNAAKKVIEEIEKITGGEIHETVKYKTVIEMIGED